MEWKFSGPAGRTAFFCLLSFPEVFEEAWKLLAAFGKDETSWLGHAPRARYYSPLVNVHPRNPQPSGVDSGWPSRWVSQVQTRAGQIGLCTVTGNQWIIRYGMAVWRTNAVPRITDFVMLVLPCLFLEWCIWRFSSFEHFWAISTWSMGWIVYFQWCRD